MTSNVNPNPLNLAACNTENPFIQLNDNGAPVLSYNIPLQSCFTLFCSSLINIDESDFIAAGSSAPLTQEEEFWNAVRTQTADQIKFELISDLTSNNNNSYFITGLNLLNTQPHTIYAFVDSTQTAINPLGFDLWAQFGAGSVSKVIGCASGSAYSRTFWTKNPAVSDTAYGITVPGVIIAAQQFTLKTDSLVVDTFLGKGEALDCYNLNMQNEAVRRAMLENAKIDQQIDVINDITDPVLQARLYKRVFGDCCHDKLKVDVDIDNEAPVPPIPPTGGSGSGSAGPGTG